MQTFTRTHVRICKHARSDGFAKISMILCSHTMKQEGWMDPGSQHVAVMTGLKHSERVYYQVGDEVRLLCLQCKFALNRCVCVFLCHLNTCPPLCVSCHSCVLLLLRITHLSFCICMLVFFQEWGFSPVTSFISFMCMYHYFFICVHSYSLTFSGVGLLPCHIFHLTTPSALLHRKHR